MTKILSISVDNNVVSFKIESNTGNTISSTAKCIVSTYFGSEKKYKIPDISAFYPGFRNGVAHTELVFVYQELNKRLRDFQTC